jgi:hypothetical protein
MAHFEMSNDTFLAVLGRARALGLSVEQVITRAVADYVPGNPGWGVEQIAQVMGMQVPQNAGAPRERFLHDLVIRIGTLQAERDGNQVAIISARAELERLRQQVTELQARVPVSVLGPLPLGGVGGLALTLQGGAPFSQISAPFSQISAPPKKPEEPRVVGPTSWERIDKDEP